MARLPSLKRCFEWLLILVLPYLIFVIGRFEVQTLALTQKIPVSPNIQILALVNLNLLLIILLFSLIVRNVIRLLIERRNMIPGAHLRTKLVVAFAGMSLLPTILLFVVASSIIITTIQNWFSDEIENSLRESLEVAQTYYKNSEVNALFYADRIATRIKEEKLLNQENLPQLRLLIEQKQHEYNLGVVEVFSATQEELVRAANPDVPTGEFTSPTATSLQKVLAGERLTRVVPAGKADLIRGIVPIYSNWNPEDVVGVVVVNHFVPYSLVSKMREISTSFEQYKGTKRFKGRVQKVYLTVLLLVALVVLFLATWFGFRVARAITDPIQELAEATGRVAAGDLEMTLTPRSYDEIGFLVNSFNRMTHDLRQSQSRVQAANQELAASNFELEQRRIYMEIVLNNVTTGVMSLNGEGQILTINPAAEKLMGVSGHEVLQRDFVEVLGTEHIPLVRDFLAEMTASGKDSLRKLVTLTREESELSLQVTVTTLRDDSGEAIGTVVVFDDLTQLQKAQRMEAWREVARRIAHEIKNPLTPIQLSAQRLRRRYLERLGPEETVFDECTSMIVKQVDELKTLVNEFSHFARMPASNPTPQDLNALIEEALVLFRSAHRDIRFDFVPAPDLPIVSLDREQIKRVLLNLLDNSVAAIQHDGMITVETVYDPKLGTATFSVADNGCGIPPENKPRLFEPYFSTKKAGTGLGLAIVSTIISDHNGYIRVRDNQPQGTRFLIELPVSPRHPA